MPGIDPAVLKRWKTDHPGRHASGIDEINIKLNEWAQLQKFVSKGTIAAIRKSNKNGVSVASELRSVAIMFTDFRNYTAFAENRVPVAVVDMLNHYFRHFDKIVTRNHGDIDKFVGDQVMVIFQGANRVRDSVMCSLDIQDLMDELNSEKAGPVLEVGIGLHVGDVIMGTIGSRRRMDYTVLGDNVNLAARLCEHAHPRQTLVSESVSKQIRSCKNTALKHFRQIRLKGVSKRVKVFEVLRTRSPLEG